MIAGGFQPNPAAFANQLLWNAIELIAIVVILWILRGIVRFLIRLLKGIWNLLFYRGKERDPLHSDNWLTRAQAKQEIRFQNALSSIASEAATQEEKAFQTKRGGRNLVSIRLDTKPGNRSMGTPRLHEITFWIIRFKPRYLWESTPRAAGLLLYVPKTGMLGRGPEYAYNKTSEAE